MKYLLQWTLKTPENWAELRPSQFAGLPRLSEPTALQRGDDNTQFGWCFDLNVQGVSFGGHDHYHVKDDGENLIVTVWDDDPVDSPVGLRTANVWTFRPLAPDPLFGGAFNTRQSQVRYADLPSPDTLPYRQFTPPANPLHGVWVSDEKAKEHARVRSLPDWRDWL